MDLKGARCPQCDALWHLEICTESWITLTRYGLTEFSEVPRYSEDSQARCNLCNWTGMVADLNGRAHAEGNETEKYVEAISAKYMKYGGLRCPYCQSKYVTTGSPEHIVGGIAVYHTCLNCEKEWSDIYTWSELELHSDLDTR